MPRAAEASAARSRGASFVVAPVTVTRFTPTSAESRSQNWYTPARHRQTPATARKRRRSFGESDRDSERRRARARRRRWRRPTPRLPATVAGPELTCVGPRRRLRQLAGLRSLARVRSLAQPRGVHLAQELDLGLELDPESLAHPPPA